MSKDPKFQALDGTYVVFDDQFVTKVDVANNTLNTMQISSGGDNLKVNNTVSIQEDNASEGYCSISAGGELTVKILTEDQVKKLTGITGVDNMKLLATAEKLAALASLLS